jgi:gamma-glutamyltranspeptidase/glutathione hydrolase
MRLVLLLLWLPMVAAAKPNGAAIASANKQATAAGMAVLAAGGNAFDAAVAVSAALSVVEPESSGLGGGGFFLLVKNDGSAIFVDAREKAPQAASRDMYLKADGTADRDKSVNGALAAAIPGLPAALVLVSEKYGRLPLADSLQPAIDLAQNGFVWSAKNAAMMGWRAEKLGQSPAAKRIFLPGGKPPAVGDRIRNRDIAKVLRAIAKHGHASFYAGPFAQRLVDGVKRAGGIWTLADLTAYRAVEREPLRFQYRGNEILTAPPPSSGGIALVGLFNILSGYDLPTMDRASQIHLMVESMRRVYRDRAVYLGDPDFVDVPLSMLSSPYYAAGLRASIRVDKATPSAMLPSVTLAGERTDTTHFSIIDAEGNIAAVTQTVNLPYGNALMVDGTGFMLNNEMDDFSVKPGVPNAFGLIGDDANAIEPGKRPLSSMTPTVLIGKDRVAALGAPGGSRIITQVFLGLRAILDGASATDAVTRPRFHHQFEPDQISVEPGALSDAEQAALKARGFVVAPAERPWGNMQIVIWNRADGSVEAASDPRWKDVGGGSTSEGSIYR